MFLLRVILFLTIGAVFWAPSPSPAQGLGPGMVNREQVAVYFDVSLKDPRLLLVRLQLIEQTLDQLSAAKVATTAVVGVRGAASVYMTTGDNYILEEEAEVKGQIQQAVRSLAARGVSFEQCLIAAHLNHIDDGDFLPEMHIVENGYISSIGYQTAGYAVIPMD